MTSKVLWGEGLLLRPQHFQRQDHYHEQCLHKSIKAVHPYAWGVEALQVDREALANSVLRLLALSVRFQDGELVDAPEIDALQGKDHELKGKRVLTTSGVELGKVKDVDFDAQTGAVTLITVKGHEIPGSTLAGVGSYAVVIQG